MNSYIVHPETAEQESALKAFIQALKINFEVNEKPYDHAFVAKIQKSRKQVANNQTVKILLDDIWKE